MNIALALVVAILLPLSASAQLYDFHTVDVPGAANTALYAINDHGRFVGALKDAGGAHHAIVGDGAKLERVDPAGPIGLAKQSWAYTINGDDDIGGTYQDGVGAFHGYVRRRGGAIELFDVPGGTDTEVYGVNDNGTVIGVFADAAGQPHAFVWRHGHYRVADLPGALQTVPLSINNRNEIVGEYLLSPDTLGYGYLQRPNGSFVLDNAPGAAPQQTYFISINDRGAVLGAYADAAGTTHSFIRRGGAYRSFELPASFHASDMSAQTLNDRDDVVGYYIGPDRVAHGFLAIAVRHGKD